MLKPQGSFIETAGLFCGDYRALLLPVPALDDPGIFTNCVQEARHQKKGTLLTHKSSISLLQAGELSFVQNVWLFCKQLGHFCRHFRALFPDLSPEKGDLLRQ